MFRVVVSKKLGIPFWLGGGGSYKDYMRIRVLGFRVWGVGSPNIRGTFVGVI